jgi:sugar (pentulose or hexulose) kinase
MFSIPAIGVNIDWYIDNIIQSADQHESSKYEQFNRAAMNSSPGAAGLIINPYKDPSSDDEYTARIKTMRQENIARALMEGAVFEMKKKLDELDRAGFEAQQITMVGGPSESPIWPQILSDVTGLQLRLINGQVAGSFGSAMMAAVGVGTFTDVREAFQAIGGTPRLVTPQQSLQEEYRYLYKTYDEQTRLQNN